MGAESPAPAIDDQSWWFRWPRDLRLWVQDVPHGPPIAIALADATGPQVAIDGTSIVRATPLRLQGDVPTDLGPLRALPKEIERVPLDGVPALGGEYLAAGRKPLILQTADVLAHTVTLLHPELLPTTVKIAAGDAGRTEVVANVERGAPCTLFVQLQQPAHARLRVFLLVRVGRRTLANVELFDALLHTDAVQKGIELAAPCALPPGRVELELSTGVRTQVQVEGKTPLRAELVAR